MLRITEIKMIYRAQRYTLLYTVLGMLIWTGCSDVLSPPRVKENGLKISISADALNGRTLSPKPVFTKYVLIFSGPSEQKHEDVTLDGNITSVLVNDLVLGVWTITATGYVRISGREYAAAEGSGEVTVISGTPQNLTIHISARQEDSVNGFFSYSVNYPRSSANSGNITIYRFGESEWSGESRDLYNSSTSDSISLTPGYYVMTIRLYNSYQTAVRTQIVHIYSNMETKAEYNFTDADFIDLITVSGKINITVNHKIPESAYIEAYLTDSGSYYDNQIDSSGIDLNNSGSWSMVIPAFDQDTTLYFRVTAYIDGSYMEQKIEDINVIVKNQNVTKDFAVDIKAITLSGTINAIYDGNPLTNIQIQIYNNDNNYLMNSYTSLSPPPPGQLPCRPFIPQQT